MVEHLSEPSHVADQSLDHSGDPSSIEDTPPNAKGQLTDEPSSWDISDFGCHAHAEETKGSEEDMVKEKSSSGITEPSNVNAKPAEGW